MPKAQFGESLRRFIQNKAADVTGRKRKIGEKAELKKGRPRQMMFSLNQSIKGARSKRQEY